MRKRPKVSQGNFSEVRDLMDLALLELALASLAEQLPDTGKLKLQMVLA